MSGFFDALALLTRIPTRGGSRTERAVPWLPVVGACIGAAVAGVYVALRGPTTPLAAAAVALAAGALLTGALHEDGLADVADAFGARVDRERTLEILKDPRHGTFGVLALILSVATRVAAVAALGPWAAFAGLVAAHAISRAGPAFLMWLLPVATPGGLGATYSAPVTARHASSAALIAAIATAGLLGPWTLLSGVLVALVTGAMGWLAMRKIGGINGDVLGATQQVSEIGVLLLAVAAGSAIPWWHG